MATLQDKIDENLKKVEKRLTNVALAKQKLQELRDLTGRLTFEETVERLKEIIGLL